MSYDREKAVFYARKHALAPNPAYKYFSLENTGGDCANFLSQCLFAGGMPMTSTWWYRKPSSKDARWAISWSVANSLFWYLKANGAQNNDQAKGYELQNPLSLKLGDLIFYENCNHSIVHSAIVTNRIGIHPLISQHSYEALDVSYEKKWLSCKMHFMSITL